MNFFRNLKLYNKIFTLIVLGLVMLACVVVLSSLSNNKIAGDGRKVYENNLQIVDSLHVIRNHIRANRSNILEMMLNRDDSMDDKTITDDIDNRASYITKEFNRLESLAMGQKNKEMYPRFREMFANYGTDYSRIMELALADKNEEAYHVYLAGANKLRQVFDMINMMVDNSIAEAGNVSAANDRGATTTMWIMIATGVIAAVVLAVLGITIANMITRPLKAVQEVSTRIAAGDLTVDQVQVKSQDEVGQLAVSINTMADNIRNLIREAADISEKVTASSEEMASSSGEMMNGIEQVSATTEELASGSTNQAMHAAETLAMITQVSQGAQEIAEDSATMRESSEQANEASGKGLQSVNQAIEQMQAIEGKVSSTANIVRSLGEKSQEINQILGVINNIAAQTNLLALNAAIEAARAGEHGRGFAVVADEVRKLAEQSSESTNQIADIIQSVQQEASQAEQSMNEVVQEVQVGSEVIDNNGQAFGAIAKVIEEMAARIAQVASASKQINERTNQALQSVENIASISEESSAGAEELAATMEQQSVSSQEINGMADNLATMAEQLNTSIAKFKF